MNLGLCFGVMLVASQSAALWQSARSVPPAIANQSLGKELPGALSRARLSPQLQAAASQLRFSPDGQYLLVQMESGLFILDRHPLQVRAWIYAPDILQARFTADSETLILATRNLQIVRWSVRENIKENEFASNVPGGCLASGLSEDGDIAACLDPQFVLSIFFTRTGERIFSEQEKGILGSVSLGLIPRSENTVYAEAFGYEVSDLEPLADRGVFGARFIFSPDSRFLILARRRENLVCIDVRERKKLECLPRVLDNSNITISFLGADQLAVINSRSPQASQVLAFPGGEFISRLGIVGETAVPATQDGYLVVASEGPKPVVKMVDWKTASSFEIQNISKADLVNNTVATYSKQGDLRLVSRKDNSCEGQIVLPAALLPTLRTAVASPDLGTILLSIQGSGGLYRTADGSLVKPVIGLRGGWFANDNELYVAAWSATGAALPTEKVDPHSGDYTDLWLPSFKFNPELTIQDTHFGGPVLFVLDDSALYVTATGVPLYPGMQRRSKLRAIDLRTGGERWSESWSGDIPAPFANPQGDSLVLGWRATGRRGKTLAKEYPILKREMDVSNLNINDAVFEVRDARSGKPQGAVLVRSGYGPESFDFVFSSGDFLICVRDGARVSIYSLASGELLERLFGYHISTSEKSGLLAATEGSRVTIYSLRRGDKAREYWLPDAPVYTHFSGDGSRLLVLTAQQFVYVLDARSSAS